MAELLWGKVYYQNQFAGYLRQEPGERYTFSYDLNYLNSGNPAIAHTLPLSEQLFISEQQLPAFFDNLVAEGWLQEAQSRMLGKRNATRFELLLAFGFDCAGAVSVVDPEPAALSMQRLDRSNPINLAAYKSRASLSGIQPKLVLVKENKKFRLAESGELSTYIAKLPSPTIIDILHNEYLTLIACQALLPEDDVVEVVFEPLPEIAEEALIIKRFDRKDDNSRIHFEEFNQLLNLPSRFKYDGAYSDMAKFIRQTPECLPTEVYRLYKRILVGILTGNTDMHLKNFAMLHTSEGLRLTPNYDQVAAAVYEPFQSMALALNGAQDRLISKLKPKDVIALGYEFKLANPVINLVVNDLAKKIEAAKDAVNEASLKQNAMKTKIIKFMEKRWNGTFSLIGQQLSKKQ